MSKSPEGYTLSCKLLVKKWSQFPASHSVQALIPGRALFFCALEAPNAQVCGLFLAGIEIRSRIGMAVVEQDF
jgi:hypothetical protein